MKEKNRILWPNNFDGEWISEEYEPGLVSVIIPTYNRAKLLVEAISSVYAQTYRPIELIIIDDGSTDDTKERIDLWLNRTNNNKNDFRIIYRFQTNNGAPSARNHGTMISKGEFVHFWDSDDLMFPHKVKTAIEKLNKTGASYFVSNDAKIVDSVGKCNVLFHPLTREYLSYPLNTKLHLTAHRLVTASVMLRRNALCLIGPWDEGLEKNQDFEYMFRLLAPNMDGAYHYGLLHIRRFTPKSYVALNKALVWESILKSIMRVEFLSNYFDICDKKILELCATHMASLSRNLALEGQMENSDVVFRKALARMNSKDRFIHKVHRIFLRLVGPSMMKRLGLM